MKKRKVIQICTGSPAEHTGIYLLWALCDDGTIWWRNQNVADDSEANWHIEQNIPQADPLSHEIDCATNI